MHGEAETLRRLLGGAIAENGWLQGRVTVPTAAAGPLGTGPCELVIIWHDDGEVTNGNTAVVWIASPALTLASGGGPMRPGDQVILPAKALEDIYVLSPTADQVLNFMYIRSNDA